MKKNTFLKACTVAAALAGGFAGQAQAVVAYNFMLNEPGGATNTAPTAYNSDSSTNLVVNALNGTYSESILLAPTAVNINGAGTGTVSGTFYTSAVFSIGSFTQNFGTPAAASVGTNLGGGQYSLYATFANTGAFSAVVTGGATTDITFDGAIGSMSIFMDPTKQTCNKAGTLNCTNRTAWAPDVSNAANIFGLTNAADDIQVLTGMVYYSIGQANPVAGPSDPKGNFTAYTQDLVFSTLPSWLNVTDLNGDPVSSYIQALVNPLTTLGITGNFTNLPDAQVFGVAQSLDGAFNGFFTDAPVQDNVPEPGSVALLGLGVLALAWSLRGKFH